MVRVAHPIVPVDNSVSSLQSAVFGIDSSFVLRHYYGIEE